jgi:dTDP-4-dehydrorhamnose 3,5-epimerase-like enzyme
MLMTTSCSVSIGRNVRLLFGQMVGTLLAIANQTAVSVPAAMVHGVCQLASHCMMIMCSVCLLCSLKRVIMLSVNVNC